jgi:replicative DNA helicase
MGELNERGDRGDRIDRATVANELMRFHLMDIHAKLRRTETERGLGLVIVDYLQLMSGRGRFENRNQEIGTISRGMKLLAKDLNVPMIVLSQLKRAPDLVAFIFREEVYRPQDPVGKVELVFLHEFTKFENRAADLREAEERVVRPGGACEIRRCGESWSPHDPRPRP